MRILIASSVPADVRWAVDHGLCDGVVFPPTPATRERAGGEPRELLAELARSVLVPVHAPVASVTPREMHRDGRALGRVADNLVVQLPLVDDAVVALRRLSTEGVRVGATLVFSAAQALLAAKAGAKTVTVPIAQLDALGHGSLAVLEQMRALFDRGGVECDIIAAHPRNAAEFTQCGLAGADAVVLDLAELRQFLVHPLTDRGVDAFLKELSARRRPRIASV